MKGARKQLYVRTDVEQNQYYLSEMRLLTVRVMKIEWLTGSKIEQPARRSESLGCKPAEEKQIPLCVPRPSRPATAGRDGKEEARDYVWDDRPQ